MGNIVAEFFGYAVMLAAVVLVLWEVYSSRTVAEDFHWLHPPARLKRRLIMAVILLSAGLLIALEASGVIVLKQPQYLIMYVISLSGMSLALLILSLRDLGDMARNAERQAVLDLQTALDKKAESEKQSVDKTE